MNETAVDSRWTMSVPVSAHNAIYGSLSSFLPWYLPGNNFDLLGIFFSDFFRFVLELNAIQVSELFT